MSYQKAAARPLTRPIWLQTTYLPLCAAGEISDWYSGTAVVIMAVPTPQIILPIIIMGNPPLPIAEVKSTAPAHTVAVPTKAAYRRPIQFEIRLAMNMNENQVPR
jgi:hypothetical protein